jgi:Ca-activated chloride channel homolog
VIRLIAVGWPDIWPPDRPDWLDWPSWLEQSDVERVLPTRLEELSFAAPELLWGLALVPLALLAYAIAQRRRGRYAVRFTNLDLLAGLVERKPGPRRHLPPLFYLVSLALLVLALARPEAPVTVAREEATVVLVMDVSGSMDAEDVAPSRLAAAKVAANTFLGQVPERFRVGIVTFSNAAQTILPPTTDHDAVRAAIAGLQANGGTAMGDSIIHALEAVPGALAASPAASPQTEQTDQAPAAVVLLSDGKNTAGATDPIEAASEAGRRSVPVFTIALGTPDGEIVTRGNQERVRVPPDEETLARVAELSGGRSFRAPTEEDLRTIYEGLGSQLGRVEERQEVTAAFAGGALALLVLGAGLAVVWFNRFP